MSERNSSEYLFGADSDANSADNGGARERRFNRPTRFGAQIPEGWISTPEYLGIQRRDAQRRLGTERRAFSRLGDGRVPRRRTHGRRFDEVYGAQYRDLFAKSETQSESSDS